MRFKGSMYRVEDAGFSGLQRSQRFRLSGRVSGIEEPHKFVRRSSQVFGLQNSGSHLSVCRLKQLARPSCNSRGGPTSHDKAFDAFGRTPWTQSLETAHLHTETHTYRHRLLVVCFGCPCRTC